jgi:hypothetical protein
MSRSGIPLKTRTLEEQRAIERSQLDSLDHILEDARPRPSTGPRQRAVIEYDDDASMKEASEELGETDGQIMSTNNTAHPLIQAAFLLKVALGAFFALAVVFQPFLVSMETNSQTTLQMTFLAFNTLLWVTTAYQWSVVEKELTLLNIRTLGYLAGNKGHPFLTATGGLIAAILFVSMLTSIASMREGRVVPGIFGSLIALNAVLIIAAGICLGRAERSLIQWA